MAVRISETAIVKLWRSNEGSLQLAVNSKVPVEQVLEVCAGTVRRLNAELDPRVVLVEPAPTPQGVAVFIDSCDDKATLLGIVGGLVADLEGAGVDAKVGVFRAEYSPLDDPFVQVKGYSAGLTLAGEPIWEEDGNPPAMRRVWDADPDAEQRVVEHAVDWCNVDGGELWLRADSSIYKIPRSEGRGFFVRALEARRHWTVLIAAHGTKQVRRVCFSGNGHVIYEVGGPSWPSKSACVDDLKSVLVELHESVVWAFVQAQLGATSGIGVSGWAEFQEGLWAPHRDEVRHRATRTYTRREGEVVPDVYGMQILGPGHALVPLGDQWQVTELSAGRRLVTHVDQAGWFFRSPALDLLLAARRDFGPLLDEDRAPTAIGGLT